MEPPKQKIITGFGLFKSAKAFVAEPKNLKDLEESLDFAQQKKFKIAIQGGGNSYGDVFFNNQLVIDTKHLNSIKSFDQENGIITVEPGIYIDSSNKNVLEKGRGIGIRIEDDVLITKNGNEVLTKDLVKKRNEIETVCSH